MNSQDLGEGWLLVSEVAEEGAYWTKAVVWQSIREHYQQLESERRAWHMIRLTSLIHS